MRAKLFIASSALAAMVWAVPSAGAAHFIANQARTNANTNVAPTGIPSPLPARFRIEKERGLLLNVWINGAGPYIFAVDTGAGLNLISDRVVGATRLPVKNVRPTIIGGLSTARTSSSREATIYQLSLGERNNTLPSTQTALIVSNLPPDLDGVLDPTRAYSPYGYSIDLPNERIAPLSGTGLSTQTRLPVEGAVVAWLRGGQDSRPFVRLGDGRLALIDTGSGFGLAVSERNAIIVGGDHEARETNYTRDISGGTISSRRVLPTTITLGELVLRRVPTDILFGVHLDAPVILGRDALYPFKISFDPQQRLIQFLTSSENG
jgi:hypothetical protein